MVAQLSTRWLFFLICTELAARADRNMQNPVRRAKLCVVEIVGISKREASCRLKSSQHAAFANQRSSKTRHLRIKLKDYISGSSPVKKPIQADLS